MRVGLSLMLEEAFRTTALPLFEAGLVDSLEYSFELGWRGVARPPWADALLDHYGAQQRLWGHGVTMSPFSAGAPTHHDAWLQRVRADCQTLQLRGVSEHYGFMGADGSQVGAPLPLPPLPEVRALGVAALGRLASASGVAVGLENLALAFSPLDAVTQAEVLTAVLDEVDGYMVLDLHNLYCQATNVGMNADGLLSAYPLERVRVLHISGGSWSEHGTRRFRRDTHDARVPQEVFALLDRALPRCPAAQTVVLEQLGPTLAEPGSAAGYVRDFRELRARVPRT